MFTIYNGTDIFSVSIFSRASANASAFLSPSHLFVELHRNQPQDTHETCGLVVLRIAIVGLDSIREE